MQPIFILYQSKEMTVMHKAFIRFLPLVLMILCCGTSLSAQFGSAGPLVALSIGPGYSRHAGSYELDRGFDVREYPGFRAYVFEIKGGWKFAESTAVFVNYKTSPANSTISPYRSNYRGFGMTQMLGDTWYLLGGAGINKAKVDKGVKVGEGTLINVGAGFIIKNSVTMEFTAYFGNMEDNIEIDPNPFRSTELMFNAAVQLSIF